MHWTNLDQLPVLALTLMQPASWIIERGGKKRGQIIVWVMEEECKGRRENLT
jgi:hypothetical protein